MNEWKTIPPNTRIRPNLATWRVSDIDDNLTEYICKGHLITEDNFIIDCVIGFCIEEDFYTNDERILPKFYKKV